MHTWSELDFPSLGDKHDLGQKEQERKNKNEEARARCPNRTEMGSRSRRGYASAISAGMCAALAAISAKHFSSQLVKYGFIVLFNVTMWGCYANSLRALSSLQATVTSFATNFLSSGLAGFFVFEEKLSLKWFLGALMIILGVLILSQSSTEQKERTD
ncbi:hypothetical protein Dimus_026083 [Dionaea muscipula]